VRIRIWTGDCPADAARIPDVSDRLANPKFAYLTGLIAEERRRRPAFS
jgi:hypothetical protein